ncbi:MAG: amino acid permease [Gammaproteobacteria bacterium RIFCSPHIGHO2_12_FULL_35_23]|nr:MAG: amino acid permease [Gammaproteobacteria bacterium RIFCSPHIGHO2_12_FULL_35_23]
MKFKKNITTVGLLFTAVGGIIGSGWLFGPFYAAKIVGPAAIFSWLLGGFMMMTIALTFAELATMFPLAGGTVRFAQLSHGTFASFTIAWVAWLAAVTVAPVETMAALQYAANYFPGLAEMTTRGVELTSLGIIIAVILMFLMCCLNMIGIQLFSKTNNIIVIWKLLIPLLTIIILLIYFNPKQFTAWGGFMPYGLHSVVAALPAAGVIFSFIGYSPAIQLAGESKNPQRAIPIAIIGSLTLCIIIYSLLQVAFIGSVPINIVSQGWAAMRFVGDTGPVAGIIAMLGIAWFLIILYLDAIISPFGTAYIYTASTARIPYAMSKNGYMPIIFQKLSIRGVPVFAILLNFIIGIFFFLPFPGWQAMVSFLVSCFVIAYAVGPIACLALRIKMPNQARPFRLPAVKPMCLIAFYVCNLIIYWTSWTTVWRMLLVVVIGYGVLFIYRFFEPIKQPLEFNKSYWVLPYFAGLGIISYLGNFAGLGIISFGWDFIILALFSVIIFYLAIRVIKYEKEAEKSV